MMAIIRPTGIGALCIIRSMVACPLEPDIDSPDLEERGCCVEWAADPWQGAGLVTALSVPDDCANVWESEGGYLNLVNVSS
jgi:hypothetical protein